MDFAVAQPLLAPLELEQPRIDVELLLEDALLDLRDLDAAVLDLALDLAAERDGLLARLDLRLAPDRLGVPLVRPREACRARHGRCARATATIHEGRPTLRLLRGRFR